MVDTPANQAPVTTSAIEHFYVRKGATTGDGFNKLPAARVANSAGKAAADKGKMFYIDANGEITTVAAGTNRQVLAYDVNGIPGPTDFSPTYRYLSTGTAAAAASIEFVSGFSTTFDEYLFQFVDVYPATDNVTLRCQISENGGSSYLATNYAFRLLNITTATNVNGSLTDTAINLLPTMDNASTSGAMGTMRLLQNTTKTTIYSELSSLDSTAANLQIYLVAAHRATTTRANAIKFYMSSGNMTGTIHMYGVTKS